MADNVLRFRATMDDKVSGPLDRMRGKFDTLGKSGGFKSVAQGVGMGVGIGALGLLTTGIGKVVDVLGDATEAALADEESQNRLRASLKANVPAFGGNTDAIEENILAKQRLGFADETLRDSLTVLVGATHDVTKAQEIQNTAMDLARFKGIDLKTASEALIKVEGGVYRSLKQLGIKLKDGATSTEALAAVQAVAAGQAEAYAETNRGKLLVSQIQVGEAMERLGAITMPLVVSALGAVADASVDVIGAIVSVTDAAKEADDWVKKMGVSEAKAAESTDFLGSKTTALGGLLHTLADTISDVVDNTVGGTHEMVETMDKGERDVVASTTAIAGGFTTMAYDAERGAVRVGKSFDEMVKDMTSDTRSLIDEVYDPAIQHAELTATKAEYADLRKVLSSSKTTKAEKRDARDRMLSLTKDADETRLQLLESGNLTASETATWLAKLRKKYASETGAAKEKVGDLIREVQRLAALKALGINISVDLETRKRDNKTGNSPRAHGGPVWPGEAYTVGEHGQETLVMGNRGGTIVPNGAGSPTFIINSTFPMNPRDAPALIKAITLEMRRQHVLA